MNMPGLAAREASEQMGTEALGDAKDASASKEQREDAKEKALL